MNYKERIKKAAKAGKDHQKGGEIGELSSLVRSKHADRAIWVVLIAIGISLFFILANIKF